ncbi:MAG: SIMPL domain-containing protein [Pseudomonadota bacterium]
MRLVIGLIAAALAASPVTAQTIPEGMTLLQVQASGEARVAPDLATFDIGITTTGETAKAAIDGNSRVAVRIRDALEKEGVEARDIQTRSVNVSPRFASRERGGIPTIEGYVANNSVAVRMRDLDRAPTIVDALFAAGANNVNGPRLTLEDDSEALAAARLDAVRNARAEADAYAAALGMRMVRVIRVSDSGPGQYDGPRPIIQTQSRAMDFAESAPSPPIAGGELTSRAQIWIDYLIAPGG